VAARAGARLLRSAGDGERRPLCLADGEPPPTVARRAAPPPPGDVTVRAELARCLVAEADRDEPDEADEAVGGARRTGALEGIRRRSAAAAADADAGAALGWARGWALLDDGAAGAPASAPWVAMLGPCECECASGQASRAAWSSWTRPVRREYAESSASGRRTCSNRRSSRAWDAPYGDG